MKSLHCIFFIAILWPSCEDYTTERGIADEQNEVRVISPSDSITIKKYPCEKWPVIDSTFPLDSGKIKISVSTNCLNDYSVIDTAVFPDNGTSEVMLKSNDETIVTFESGDRKRSVSITKNLIDIENGNQNLVRTIDTNFMKTVVFVNPIILDFRAKDTAVILSGLLGPPNSDNIIVVKYQVYFNGKKEVIAFEEPEFD